MQDMVLDGALNRLVEFRKSFHSGDILHAGSGLSVADIDAIVAACRGVPERHIALMSALVLAGSHEGQVIEIQRGAALVEIPREEVLIPFAMPSAQTLGGSLERYVVVPFADARFAVALVPAGDRDLRAALEGAVAGPVSQALQAELERRLCLGGQGRDEA